jgi:transketolase
MLHWAMLHLTGTYAVNAGYEILGQSAVSLHDITYAVCGDVCMMEGSARKLVTSLSRATRGSLTEDIAARFSGYGWNVLPVGDANDLDLIEHALGVFY